MNTQTALHKKNLALPLSYGSKGYVAVSLLKRYEAAVRHLMETHKGALYVDPNYGSTFYRMRTQGMNDDAGIVELEEFIAAAARYIPDITISRQASGVVRDQDGQRMSIYIVWGVAGAVPEVHGDLGRPQKTTVQI